MATQALIVILLSLGLAAPASSATLFLRGDDFSTFRPGESFTLELIALIEGNEVGSGLDVRVNGSDFVTWTGATQVGLTSTISGHVLPWTVFPTICSGGDPCVAINQGNPVPLNPQPADPFEGVIATMAGVYPAGAFPPPGFPFEVEVVAFFDFSGPVPFIPVPEPGTSSLIGLALVGLGLVARRSRPTRAATASSFAELTRSS